MFFGLSSWESVWKIVFCLFFSIVAVISLIHLLPQTDRIAFPTAFLGILGWLLLAVTLICFSRSFRKQAGIVFLAFFLFGLLRGPFLEPPADSFEHLRRINTVATVNTDKIKPTNGGLWHYSMASLVLNTGLDRVDAHNRVWRIHLCHGLFLGAVMGILYIAAKLLGLSGRWAVFSCLIAFFFLGTNAISYFTYYSFAPTFTSLPVYWLWAGVFFLKRTVRNSVLALAVALACIPILMVNHLQEAAFLLFLCAVWLVMNFTIYFYNYSKKKLGGPLSLWLLGLFILFFCLPQVEFLRETVDDYFLRNHWHDNQDAVMVWNGLYLGGKIWAYRIHDTFLNIGLLLLLLYIPYLWVARKNGQCLHSVKISILAFLPFLGYFLPLFHYIWLANVRLVEYYRLCYTSMFWIYLAVLFQGIEALIKARFGREGRAHVL